MMTTHNQSKIGMISNQYIMYSHDFKMSTADPVYKRRSNETYWDQMDSSALPTKSVYNKKRAIVRTAKS